MSDRRMLDELKVINPYGKLITIPAWLIRHFDKMKMLKWDRKAKHYKMTDTVKHYLIMLQDMSGFVPKPLRAMNLEHTGGRSKDSGCANPILRALGADCSGLNVSTEVTRRLVPYQEPKPQSERELYAELIVREVKSARGTI